jgi:hypothetical protein
MQREAHEAQSRMLGWNSENPYATTAQNLARSGSASLFRHGETVELHRAAHATEAHAASRRVPLTAWSSPAGASRASTWVTPPFKSPRLAQLSDAGGPPPYPTAQVACSGHAAGSRPAAPGPLAPPVCGTGSTLGDKPSSLSAV